MKTTASRTVGAKAFGRMKAMLRIDEGCAQGTTARELWLGARRAGPHPGPLPAYREREKNVQTFRGGIDSKRGLLRVGLGLGASGGRGAGGASVDGTMRIVCCCCGAGCC